MRKRAVRIAIITALVLAVGAAIAYNSLFKSEEKQQQTRSVAVSVGEVRPTVTATGYISAASQTLVNFENSGKLIEVNVKAGDVVEAGAQLGKIDTYDLERALEQAEANLTSARIKREQSLGNDDANIQSNQIGVDSAKKNLDDANTKLAELKSDYPTPNDQQQAEIDKQEATAEQSDISYQQALIKLNSAKAARDYDEQMQDIQVEQSYRSVEDAERDLEGATLTAPVGGTVIQVNYSVGDNVSGSSGGSKTASGTSNSSSSTASTGSAFVVIGDPTKSDVMLTVDQSDIAKVKTGMEVEITVDAIENKTFKGKITSIDPTPVTSSGVTTFTVVASVDKPDAGIRQGMSVTTSVNLGAKKNVVVVPNMAIRTASGGKVVRKMVDGTATDVKVIVGTSDDNYTEIVSGLMENDQIVVDVFEVTAGQTTQRTGQGSSGFPMMGGDGGPRPRGGF